jgi:FKBP-type peptidyl-prolyl cis-trans isomerase
MKTGIFLIIAALAVFAFTGCKSYKKTKTGLVYRIIPGGNKKDSLAKPGNIVKFNFIRKLNDSVLQDSYGKLPGYARITGDESANYTIVEILPLLRKGDSAISIEMGDTLINKGIAMQVPFTIKKGDRISTAIRVLEIFANDSLGRADYEKEYQKDLPRQQKEMEAQQAKLDKQRIEQAKKDWDELKKSGEMEKGIKAMEAYLARKKITAQKTNDGTFVVVKEKGGGEPAVDGKFISVKYTGRILETDSVFESNRYTFKMGTAGVIRGWDDGLKLFNKGGKGVLYIPGYLAYGKNPGPGSKAYEALIFDVEVVNIGTTKQAAEADVATTQTDPAATNK